MCMGSNPVTIEKSQSQRLYCIVVVGKYGELILNVYGMSTLNDIECGGVL